MKTKNNTFKRIAAGALAAISVASYTMPANVGGVLVNSLNASLVAQAAEKQTINLGDVSKYITSFSDGTSTFDNAALSGMNDYTVAENKTVTIKSSIPLTFKKYISKEKAFGIVEGSTDKVIADDNKVYEKVTDGTVKQAFVKKNAEDKFQLAKVGTTGVDPLTEWTNVDSANRFDDYSVYPAGKELKVMSQFGESAVEKVIAYEDEKGDLVAEDRLLDLGDDAKQALEAGNIAFKTAESVDIAKAFTKAKVLNKKQELDPYSSDYIGIVETKAEGAEAKPNYTLLEPGDVIPDGKDVVKVCIFKKALATNSLYGIDSDNDAITVLSAIKESGDAIPYHPSEESADGEVMAFYPITFNNPSEISDSGSDFAKAWKKMAQAEALYKYNEQAKKFDKVVDGEEWNQYSRYFVRVKEVTDGDGYTTTFKATGDYTLLNAEGAPAVLKDKSGNPAVINVSDSSGNSTTVNQLPLMKDTVVDEKLLLEYAAQYGIKTKQVNENGNLKTVFDYDTNENLQAVDPAAVGATTNKLYPGGTVGIKKATDNTLAFVTPFEIKVTVDSDNRNEAEFEVTQLLVTAPASTNVISNVITNGTSVKKYSTKKFAKNGNECEIGDVIQSKYTLVNNANNTKTLIEFDEKGNAKAVEKINTAYNEAIANAKSDIEANNVYEAMTAPVDNHKADDMFVPGKEFYYDVLSQEGNTPDVTLKMSGNTYVYTYKVAGDGLVKLSGVASNVTITNGLGGDTGKSEWGSTSPNATVKDTLVPVENLKFISDLTDKTADAGETQAEAYQSENVVLASDHFFKIRVWDGQLKTAYKEYATKYNAEKGRWEATFPVFNVTADERGTQVLVEKADPVYNYTTEGSVLKVTGSGIDQEAAYIRAYGVPAADVKPNTVKPNTDDEKKKYEMTSGTSLAFGSKVYVDIGRVKEFANGTNAAGDYATLKITRNGKEIKAFGENPYHEETTNYNGKVDNVVAFDADKSGEYEITYTVFINSNNNTSVAKELKYKFTIEAHAKLTAKDVKVTFSAGEKNLITGATYNEDTKKWEKVITGADNIKLYVDVDDLKNKSIDVSAQLMNPDNLGATIKATVSGATTVNELNLSQPIYITYNDELFSTGPETIVINWIALSKSKEFKLCQVDGETPLYNESKPNFPLNVSVDEIEDIQNIVEDNYVLKNGDSKKISYEYSVGKGDKLESHELDWHEAGFPKEIGDYSLYILYDNEPLAIIDLNVIEHGLHAVPTEDQLNITYGDKVFSAEDLAYADADGKAVADAKVNNPTVTIYKATQLSDAQAKQITDGKYMGESVSEKDGKFYIIDKNDIMYDDEHNIIYDANNNTIQKTYSTADLLSAGAYIVNVSSNAGTTVGKEGYTLLNDKFVLNVAKKQITADMITIAPQKYENGAEIKIEQKKITGTDAAVAKNFTGANASVKLKVASGQQTGKEIGAYTVNVTVADNEQNYEGTVKNFKWYIIKAAEDDGENFSGIFWNDAETTIVDNGNINVEFGKDANLKGDVVEFGFIGDKSGKIGAPAGIYKNNKTDGTFNYSSNFDNNGKPISATNENKADANVQAAYSELVYGAGITPAKQNATMIAKKGKDTFGVSVRIEDANTGVWVRPYLILKIDGVEKLYYGEVRYLNLVEEATDMLNLKASAIGDSGATGEAAQKAKTKDEAKAGHKDNTDLAYMDEARSGYRADKNQFYAYAHYNFDKNSKVRDSAIQGFGVVLDKNGYIPAAEYDNAGNIITDSEAYKKAKEVLKPENKGKNGILSGLSKDNPKMLKNEMGVAVNPKDAVTGVWIRSFVDFGNGLIVYTDPVYVKSVSEQYAACKPTVECVKNQNAAKIDYTVTATGVPTFNNKAATIKEAGLVVDKNGTLFKLNQDGAFTEHTEFVDDATTKLIAENAKTYGYNKGKSAIDAIPSNNVIFKGHALQVTDKSGNYYKTVARPFVVYTINGIDVTIYGDLNYDKTAGTVPAKEEKA